MKPSITKVLEHYGATGVPEWGSWRSMRCPFHDDRIASASVNHEYGEFYCHVCGVRGDAIGVVMKAEGIKYWEARKKVEEITGHSIAANPDADTATTGGRRRSLLPAWTRGRKPRKRVFA